MTESRAAASLPAMINPKRRPVRLLTIGHSYVVALNRRMAHAIADASDGRYEVTVVAPSFFHGDLRPIALEPYKGSRAEPVTVLPLRVHGSKRPHMFVFERRLKDVLRQEWDLVHCWEEPYVFAGAQIAWWAQAHTPLVYLTYQNIAKRYPPPFGWLETRTLQRAQGLISGGRTVAEVQQVRVATARAHARSTDAFAEDIITLGVDTAVFTPDAQARRRMRDQLGLVEADGPVVVYMGRLVEEKGIRVLMSAMTNQARSGRPHQLLILGAGPMESDLRAWAAQHPHRVRVFTAVPHEDVPDYLRAADVLIAPSQTRPTWREQLGRMLLEGFATGLAVVGSDSGEIPYVIADAGIVVPEADECAWSDAIGELLAQPDRIQSLGRKGRARAEATYSWDAVGIRLVQYFDRVLGLGADVSASASTMRVPG